MAAKTRLVLTNRKIGMEMRCCCYKNKKKEKKEKREAPKICGIRLEAKCKIVKEMVVVGCKDDDPYHTVAKYFVQFSPK